LTINGKTGEFEYVGNFERMLSEFRSLALGGSGQLMSACRSFLGVMDKDEFLKIDGTTLSVKLTTGPYTATTGLTDIQGEASARPNRRLILDRGPERPSARRRTLARRCGLHRFSRRAIRATCGSGGWRRWASASASVPRSSTTSTL